MSKNIILWCFVISASLNADVNNFKAEQSCYEIVKQIEMLKKEKNINITASIGTILFGGNYPLDNENKKIDMKIQILRLKLLNCY